MKQSSTKPHRFLSFKQTAVYGYKYITLLFGAIVVLLPIYLLVLTSFKTSAETGDRNLFALPASFFNFDNFYTAYSVGKIGLAFYNTAIVILLSLIGNVVFGTMLAYALGRFQFKLKNVIIFAYLMAIIIPSITTQVATFGVIKSLGLFNTFFGPSLLYVGTDVLQVYIYLQFVKNIPYALDESAMIEGASLFRIFYSIIFPLLAPATATIVILKTIGIYNDLFTPLFYLPSADKTVVSTSLMYFIGPHLSEWNTISAAMLIIILPTVILFLFMQKFIFSGITSGAVK